MFVSELSELSRHFSLDLSAEIAHIDAGEAADTVVDVGPVSSAQAARDDDDIELAWNNTPSCVRTQRHVIRNRRSQFARTFSVDAVVCGDRDGALTNRLDRVKCIHGAREVLSELLITSALSGDIEVVSRVANSPYAHVDVADRGGNTALHCAAVSHPIITFTITKIVYTAYTDTSDQDWCRTVHQTFRHHP